MNAPMRPVTTETTQHRLVIPCAPERALVSWLLGRASVNNLGLETDAFPIVHRAVAVLDRAHGTFAAPTALHGECDQAAPHGGGGASVKDERGTLSPQASSTRSVRTATRRPS